MIPHPCKKAGKTDFSIDSKLLKGNTIACFENTENRVHFEHDKFPLYLEKI